MRLIPTLIARVLPLVGLIAAVAAAPVAQILCRRPDTVLQDARSAELEQGVRTPEARTPTGLFLSQTVTCPRAGALIARTDKSVRATFDISRHLLGTDSFSPCFSSFNILAAVQRLERPACCGFERH